MDIFEKRIRRMGPIGELAAEHDGYFAFPELEGPISSRMRFKDQEMIVWSLNNYLGLANHPEVRQADADAANTFGLAHPMGARMMSGENAYIQTLEAELAAFTRKPAAMLLNYGYQGVISLLDALLDRHDIVLYDADSHASIVDGLRMHQGKRMVFKHNDLADLEHKLQRAMKQLDPEKGGILVVTEGVFGMAGDQGKIREIAALKEQFPFRMVVDDAHGFGVMGKDGSGTCVAQQVQDETDIYFSTFAKSMASIGAFISADKEMIRYLRFNMRSQIFAKTLPTPIVVGLSKRLELLQNQSELRTRLWEVSCKLQTGLLDLGFDLGRTNTPVTPVYIRGGIPEAKTLILTLRTKHSVFCSLVVYPVVPKGIIMMRLIPTAVHSDEDVEKTLTGFAEARTMLEPMDYVRANDRSKK